MEFGLNEILTIIDKVKNTELSLFEYQDMDTRIRIKGAKHVLYEGNDDELRSEVSESSSEDLKNTESETGRMISSPMVGTFYTAPAEGEEPFVRIGDAVKKGQVIGIVEAMKLMNEIESEYDGVVEEILAANEQMVEYGQPLIRLREV